MPLQNDQVAPTASVQLEMSSPTARASALDGLRGLAASAVVVYHAILHNDLTLIDRVLYQPLQTAATPRDALTKLFLVLFNGEAAVFIFFVLSGCVLRLSLSRQGHLPAHRICMGFATARIVRLYPPVIVCMLFFFGVGHLGVPGLPVFTGQQLLANASLWSFPMHGPSLTIQSELLAIPFILTAWLLRRRFGPPVAVLAIVYGILAIDTPAMVFWLPNMHAYLIAFMAGMLAAEPRLKIMLIEAPGWAWWYVLAGVILCRTLEPHASLPSLIAFVAVAALLVAGLLHGQRGTLHWLLESGPIQALGRVSFSFYLFNVPVLYAIWAWSDRQPWIARYALESGLAVAVVSFGPTFILAWMSERWIERPAVIAGRFIGSLFREGMPMATTIKAAE
jgi:peptidoglycan/LPS O-acetylase OafA/YrhL